MDYIVHLKYTKFLTVNFCLFLIIMREHVINTDVIFNPLILTVQEKRFVLLKKKDTYSLSILLLIASSVAARGLWDASLCFRSIFE